MKILMLIIRHQGGHGTVAKGLKKELEKREHIVEIISRDDDGLSKSDLRKFVKGFKDNYDIIYTSDWSMALPLLFPYPIAMDKHYCLFHGHNPTQPGKFIQTLVGMWMGKKLFVVGDTLKERFPKSTLVYNGVDFETFYDLKKERKYLGWIERDYDLITKSKILDIAKTSKLPVLIANHIPYDKMNEFYNKCKVFVSLPPDYSGFNLAWLEAMAAGVKNIVVNENGIGKRFAILDLKDFTWKNNVDKLLEVWQ